MKFVIFCHSLASDWNHGNAHFLRGVASELVARGHRVVACEPANGWSRRQLLKDHGQAALTGFSDAYPELETHTYDPAAPELERRLEGADVVLVHEWSDPAIVRGIGRRVAGSGTIALFHDTHHRMATAPAEMAAFDLRHYHGVLAFGEVIRRLYLARGWAARAWTWHEAADVRRFRPLLPQDDGDLIWIGNWGDEERTRELEEFLLDPVRRLGLRASTFGVRYPEAACRRLARLGVRHGGWLPNHRVPEAYAGYRVTVHVPRQAYRERLPGIPTIRVFEALACGIPLVCAEWEDCEGLFDPGTDYLVARDGAGMRHALRAILADRALATALAVRGRATILARHTCAHRVDALLGIVASLQGPARRREAARRAVPLTAGAPA